METITLFSWGLLNRAIPVITIPRSTVYRSFSFQTKHGFELLLLKFSEPIFLSIFRLRSILFLWLFNCREFSLQFFFSKKNGGRAEETQVCLTYYTALHGIHLISRLRKVHACAGSHTYKRNPFISLCRDALLVERRVATLNRGTPANTLIALSWNVSETLLNVT